MWRRGLLLFLFFPTSCVSDAPSGTDAGADSPNMPDTGVPDTGVDSGTDSGTSFCTGKPFDFCADFDLVPTAESGWTKKIEENGGLFTLDPTVHQSAPNAANAATPISDAGSPTAYVLEVIDQKGKAGIRVEADVYMKTGPLPAGTLQLIGLQSNGGGSGDIVVWQRPTGWFVNRSSGNSTTYGLSAGPVMNEWHRISIEVHWGAAGSIKAMLDGNGVLDVPSAVTAMAMNVQTTSVTLGALSFGTGVKAFVSYDNVTVETLP